MKKLPKDFYTRSCIKVAKELLGKILVKTCCNKVLSGIIVETEAYPGKNDPASHSFIGKTKRNEVMFSEGGKGYVYFTYGNHFCFNVVTGKENTGSAVLVRSIEPLEGIGIFKKNRKTDDINNLTNGPGKVCQAFGIGRNDNGVNLTGDYIFIKENPVKKKFRIANSARIGITRNREKLWRFYIEGNPFVSNKRKKLNDRSTGTGKNIQR
jgi:DNA-3-methyladenine glycosylase